MIPSWARGLGAQSIGQLPLSRPSPWLASRRLTQSSHSLILAAKGEERKGHRLSGQVGQFSCSLTGPTCVLQADYITSLSLSFPYRPVGLMPPTPLRCHKRRDNGDQISSSWQARVEGRCLPLGPAACGLTCVPAVQSWAPSSLTSLLLWILFHCFNPSKFTLLLIS